MLIKRCYRVDPKQIEEIMEVIKEFFPENTSIAISDTNEYLYYQPSKKVDLKIKPGETTEDGEFTLGATRCIGACGLAPVFTIDGHVYGSATPNMAKKALQDLLNNK